MGGRTGKHACFFLRLKLSQEASVFMLKSAFCEEALQLAASIDLVVRVEVKEGVRCRGYDSVLVCRFEGVGPFQLIIT
jgi:hypothetical protein